ncbi:MAG TPA: PIN domain-containing protein [Duganella sp.]|nr:PIN domain-containing protein [Duganella sp.]
MVKVLFDTNIFIDHFNKFTEATIELATYDDAVISTITWMEVACTFNAATKQEFAELLKECEIRIVQTDEAIMFRSAALRGHSLVNKPKIGLPDCIIAATADVDGRLIITRNPADFGGEGPRVRVPYDIVAGKVVNVKPPAA